MNPTNVGHRSQDVELYDGDEASRPSTGHHHLPLMDIVLRAVILFVFVWFVTRAVGRRELSTLEPFDLILLVVLGDLIQQG